VKNKRYKQATFFDSGENQLSKYFDKNKTLITSFSGGRTSGYLTKKILEHKNEWKDVVVTFANTGQEHDKTLDFIHNCDTHFNFNTVWLEAKITHERGVGTRHTIVDYKTASRKGEPFEQVIKKHGIPFSGSPHCTRELKNYPILSYIKSLGLTKKDYVLAIGIRADESKRANRKNKNNMIYPLVDLNIDKQDVLDWWQEQTFDLEIPEHFGNCTWCWKKSYKKLMTIMIEEPSVFDFPKRIEQTYARNGPVARRIEKDIKFFRGFKSVKDIEEMITEDFEKFTDLHHLHITDGCSESCEPFHDEINNNLIDTKEIL
tara:strand:+ start:743 stop:1693 length:951 start_codon:yes stop_codon:yes gene_type:complete